MIKKKILNKLQNQIMKNKLKNINNMSKIIKDKIFKMLN